VVNPRPVVNPRQLVVNPRPVVNPRQLVVNPRQRVNKENHQVVNPRQVVNLRQLPGGQSPAAQVVNPRQLPQVIQRLGATDYSVEYKLRLLMTEGLINYTLGECRNIQSSIQSTHIQTNPIQFNPTTIQPHSNPIQCDRIALPQYWIGDRKQFWL
jgi:hypothetical protein